VVRRSYDRLGLRPHGNRHAPVLGLIITGIVVLVRYLSRGELQGGARAADRPTAEQVLAERFARGEIDEEEYRRRLDTLRGGGSSVTRL